MSGTGAPPPSAPQPPRCYVASPLGFGEAGRHYYATVYLPALRTVVEPVDPWALTSAAEVVQAAAAGRQAQMALEIGRRNIAAIDSCALLVAHLDGQELDSGTAAEVGYASARGLRCFGLRTDLRDAGEPGALVNLQVQTFIVESGGAILPTLELLLAALSAGANPAS